MAGDLKRRQRAVSRQTDDVRRNGRRDVLFSADASRHDIWVHLCCAHRLGRDGAPTHERTDGAGQSLPEHRIGDCLFRNLPARLAKLVVVAPYLTPIQHFVTTAEAVSGGDLAARVDVSDAKVVISEAQLLGASFNKVISDLQADRNQMTKALDAALKGERAKSQFLTVMSHEVRTPMHGLMGVLELIEGGTTDDDQRYLLTVGQKAANDMVRLLDDALLFAKLEANAQKSEVSKFNLADVVQSVIALFHPLASQKGLSLTSTVSDQMLRGDPQSISQILLNLVGSAVKFTTEGKIHIAAELGSDGFGADRLILSVSDSGIGIAKGAQATIFEEFYQVDSELSRTNEGSGLGLAISWRLARLMKGEISLTSEPSIGSCFQLSIPVCVVEV